MRALKEGDFQKPVIELAEWSGWSVYHVANVKGQLRSATGEGFPDLVLARGPRLLFRELKVGKNKPTAKQLIWGALLLAAGQDWKVWRPKDWPEIKETLRRE